MWGTQTEQLRPALGWALIAVVVAAFLSAFLSLQWGLFVLLFTVVAWWAWQSPEEGFWLFIVIAPLLPLLKITQSIGTVTLLKDVLILTLFVRLVLWPLWQQQLPYRRNIVWGPLVALGIWTVVSLLRADELLLGILRARDIGLYALLYLVVVYLPHTPERFTARLRWFTSSAVLVLALGVYQWFFAVDSAVLRFDPVREVWFPRISSTLAHPSVLGEYLVAMFAVWAAVLVWAKSTVMRVLALGIAVASIMAVYATFSRGVWLGLVLAALGMTGVVVYRHVLARGVSRRLVTRGVGGALLVGVVSFAVLWSVPQVQGLLRSVVDPTYGSNEERLEFMARLIAPLSDTEALIGAGLGDVLAQNFRHVDVSALDIAAGQARAVQQAKDRTLVDNQYLKTFVEMGLVGVLVYVWLYWRVLRYSWRLVATGGQTVVAQVVGVGVFGFTVAFMLQALFIDIWDIFPTNAIFWILAAFVSVLQVPLKTRDS